MWTCRISITSSREMPRCSASSLGEVPAEALRELVRGLVEAGLLLDDPAGDADGPRAVAEVAPDLASDRGDGERQEVDAAFRLEPVERPDQPQRRDLLEVVRMVAAVQKRCAMLWATGR